MGPTFFEAGGEGVPLILEFINGRCQLAALVFQCGCGCFCLAQLGARVVYKRPHEWKGQYISVPYVSVCAHECAYACVCMPALHLRHCTDTQACITFHHRPDLPWVSVHVTSAFSLSLSLSFPASLLERRT
jgi:hypothetical protein